MTQRHWNKVIVMNYASIVPRHNAQLRAAKQGISQIAPLCAACLLPPHSPAGHS